MEAIGLLVMLEARAGKEADAEAFLKMANSGRVIAYHSKSLFIQRDGEPTLEMPLHQPPCLRVLRA